jgi:hypothetical protein
MRAIPALLVVVALAGCGGDDAEQPAAPAVSTRFAVEVTGAGARPVQVELACGGSRPCDAKQLAALRDALRRARKARRACTQIYGGDERAHVTGTLEGRPVDVTVARRDGCGMADYDALFAALGRPAPLAP